MRYMVHLSELEMAEQNAIEIAKFLKENYSKKDVKKVSLKVKFNLPQSRSVMVWFLLSRHGLKVNQQTISVP